MMGKTDGGGNMGERMGERRRFIASTITKRFENIKNPHNCVDLQDGGGRNISNS